MDKTTKSSDEYYPIMPNPALRYESNTRILCRVIGPPAVLGLGFPKGELRVCFFVIAHFPSTSSCVELCKFCVNSL